VNLVRAVSLQLTSRLVAAKRYFFFAAFFFAPVFFRGRRFVAALVLVLVFLARIPMFISSSMN
jgi:hypothetical protein